jgi:hypothetical protein
MLRRLRCRGLRIRTRAHGLGKSTEAARTHDYIVDAVMTRKLAYGLAMRGAGLLNDAGLRG